MRPTNANIYAILCNPAYAGAFVYGRRAKARDGSANPDRRVNKPMEEWIAVHQDMYPAYISWEEYLANRERLKRNGYRVTENRLGAPREGPALLSGLAVCGHCGRRMGTTYSGSKNRGAYLCNALRATHGAPSCLYVAARRVDEAVVEAFFEAMRPSEISLLEEVLAAESADRERLLKHHHDSVKGATYEVRLAEKRYRSVDPENRLVAAELEKGWEIALRSLSEAREAAESFEREHQRTALDPALRAQLADFGKHLPKLWESGKLCVEHKKELLRSLISRVILSRPEQQNIEARIVWISGAVLTLSVRTPIRRARDLRDYEVLVGEILAMNAESYPDSKIARRLTEEGLHSARGEEGVPTRFVTEVRRQHGQGSVSKMLKSQEKLEGCWTVLGLARETSSGPRPHLQAHPKRHLADAASSPDRQPSHRGIGDFLKSVVYLPFEQSNGKPTLARRREGDTDGEDTSGSMASREELIARSRRDRPSRSEEDARRSTGGRGRSLHRSGQGRARRAWPCPGGSQWPRQGARGPLGSRSRWRSRLRGSTTEGWMRMARGGASRA